jgi:arylsulfatase A-like enzyme
MTAWLAQLRSRSRGRRSASILLLVGTAFPILIPAGLGCGPAAESSPANVVLVSLDTLRADHLSLYGHDRPTSPELDALARESVVFEWAQSPAAATQPSHRAIYQSRIPSHTRRKFTVLAEVLRDAGYRTAGFTGEGNVSKRFGFDRGFNLYEEDIEGFSLSYPKLEKWLRANAADPFFVFFHSFDIHHPYTKEPPFDRIFFPEYRGAVTGPDTLNILSKIRGIFPHANFHGELRLSAADKKQIISLYDGGILYADQYVGRLVALLKELGQWDNTLLVVTSDHGEEFWEHGNVTHAFTVYDEVLHVPLAIHLPRHAGAGTRVSRRVHLIDIAPTILDVLGIEAPESFMGKSLLPFERLDSEAYRPEPMVSEMYTLKTLVSYPWKIIKEYPDGKRHLATAPLVLYNLERDPAETRNVLSNHPEKAAELEAELGEIISRYDTRQVRDVPAVVEDDQLRKNLEALGYVVGDPEESASEQKSGR